MHKKVLLVDDDRKLVGVTKRSLELRGYAVLTALDVQSARRVLAEKTPDVILMDINLQDDSGVDLCREIRAESDVPVIFVTGLEKTDALLESGFDAGCGPQVSRRDDYMTKPVNFNELALRIEAVLRRVKRAGKVSEPPGIDEAKFERLTVDLGKREKEVARLIALGKTNHEIAEYTGFTIGHIKNMSTLVYAQMGTANRAELIELFKV